MDIAVERNAYGRQIDSRVAEIEPEAEFQQRTAPGKLQAVFIRAPIIREVGGRRGCSRDTMEIRCLWNRASIWLRPSIRN